MFYPLTWISLLLGNISEGHKLFYWIEWQIPLHMILAGLFTFFLLRYLGLAIAPAFFGATVYQLGGFFASQAQHLGSICCGAWLPLVLLSVWKLKRGVTATGIALLAVGVALSVLSGFIAATVVVLTVAAMASIALVLSVRTKFRFACFRSRRSYQRPRPQCDPAHSDLPTCRPQHRFRKGASRGARRRFADSEPGFANLAELLPHFHAF